LQTRHEILRSAFWFCERGRAAGRLVQVVALAPTVEANVIDLRGIAALDRENSARRLAVDAGSRPFDLTSSGLFRVQVLRLADERHLLHLVAHRIVADEQSMRLLWNELATFYRAFVRDEPPSLPPPTQYSELLDFETAALTDSDLERQLAYWTERLA